MPFFQIPVEDTGIPFSSVRTHGANLAHGTASGLEFPCKKNRGERWSGQVGDIQMQAKGSRHAVGNKANVLQFGGLVEGENTI